jgi:hypothetical protein
MSYIFLCCSSVAALLHAVVDVSYSFLCCSSVAALSHAVVDVLHGFLTRSLSPNSFALFAPGRGATLTLAFPAFSCESLNAVLLLSELSDQLDVTLESSKIVKLAPTWVATTQSDAIK